MSEFSAVWQLIEESQNKEYQTSRGLPFTYQVKGYELFVDRRQKSLTRSTVEIAYKRAKELECVVTGPKKLGVFGASYIYPIFLKLGIITKE